MADPSAPASLPERQLSEAQSQHFRDFIIEPLGFVPPRIDARTRLVARLDSDLWTMQEDLRRRYMYPKVFDVKKTQLMLFGTLRMNLQDAAKRTAIAAYRDGAPTSRIERGRQSRVSLSRPFRGELSRGNFTEHRQRCRDFKEQPSRRKPTPIMFPSLHYS